MPLRSSLLLLILLSTFYVSAQCDNLTAEKSTYGYRERNGRCEGLYISNVDGLSIQIVSITRGAVYFSMNTNENLIISTHPISGFKKISIRGINFAMDTNYRLDMTVNAGSGISIPVKDVLEPSKISFEKLGLFGHVEKEGRRLYVPVMPKSSLLSKVKDASHLTIRFISNVDLKKVTWRYAPFTNDRCGKYSSQLSLSESLFPRDTPIDLEIPQELLTDENEKIICIQIHVQAVNGLEFNENIPLIIPGSY
jgi:hypothetical protein